MHRVDSGEHWPISKKKTIQWFTFITILEHTAKKWKKRSDIIIINVFAMFEIRLSYEDKKMDVVSLKYINCKRETGLNPETKFSWVFDEIITKFVLNAILHHVGISWIISSNKEINYEIKTESNHLDWLNKGPWYNRNICSKLHG